MAYLVSFGLHLLTAFVFFILIPLPVLLKAMNAEGAKALKKLLHFYKIILWLAHGALIVTLVTGLIMHFNFASFWLWVVLILWIAIGAYLGLSAKYLRICLEHLDKGVSYEEALTKLQVYSVCLMLGIVAMFVIKYTANWL